VSDLVGGISVTIYPTAFNPATGSARTVVGQIENRIAGSGISHLVKLRPTQVLLRSKRIVYRHSA